VCKLVFNEELSLINQWNFFRFKWVFLLTLSWSCKFLSRSHFNDKMHFFCKLIFNWATRLINAFRVKLIIKSSFELTFWIQLNSKSSCSHFQLNLSQIEHIFNLTWLDSTENWINSTWFIKNSSLTLRKLNIEIFPTFALSFCIIFLIESHEEKTWRLFDKKS